MGSTAIYRQHNNHVDHLKFTLSGFGPVKDLQCFEQVVVWERPETPRDCELDQYQVIVRKDDMVIQRFDREQSFLVLENTPELRGVSGALIMEVSVIMLY